MIVLASALAVPTWVEREGNVASQAITDLWSDDQGVGWPTGTGRRCGR